MMNRRTLSPRKLVALGALEELRGVRLQDGTLDVGALCTHAELAVDPTVGAHIPAASAMFAGIANVRVRAFGTLGGNLVYADPSQDPAVLLAAVDAEVVVAGPSGTRAIPVAALADAPFTCVLRSDEIVTRVRVPQLPPRTATAYEKLWTGSRSGYATVSVAARISASANSRVVMARLVAGSVGPCALVLTAAADVLIGQAMWDEDVWTAVAERVRESVSPVNDYRGSADYKREVAAVSAVRAIRSCVTDLARPGTDHAAGRDDGGGAREG
jgi:CO/xanthine dehydrogenase FAD-binding subunit